MDDDDFIYTEYDKRMDSSKLKSVKKVGHQHFFYNYEFFRFYNLSNGNTYFFVTPFLYKIT